MAHRLRWSPMYKCLCCGFLFNIPVTEWRRVQTGAFSAQYVPIKCCPRCGSDAIRETELGE